MFGGAWRLYDTKVVQSLNHVWLSVTLWAAPCQASLSFTISWSLLRLMAIESLMPPNHLILSCPLLLLLSVFPSIGSFPISQLFASGGQSIRASASASVLPKSIQSWFPLGWTGWISLQSKGLSRVFSSTTVWKHPFFSTQPFFFFLAQFSHPYMTTGKTIALTIQTLSVKWCLCFLICCLGLSSLRKGMANHSSILALRTLWTVWKDNINRFL